ncbi:MAG TPA: hypothetical protein VIP98_05595 [Microlunatus sp.]
MSEPGDFGPAPWSYPGTPIDRSDPIDRLPQRGRSLVVAVGSNASRAVLERKFGRAGVPTTVPLVRARVTGIRQGHSAHVSVPGYVPAAPIADPTATSNLVASFLDQDQLAALDETEPNYHRLELDAEQFPIELDHGLRPGSYFVYWSRHGVLATPGQRPLSLGGQEQLFDQLIMNCVGFSQLATGLPRAVMQALAASAELRTAAGAVFRDSGWISRDGFTR